MARERSLDLVEISPNAVPPVCRIQDYGKFLYEKDKSERAARKKQKVITIKEVKFSVTVDEHDYQTKKNMAIRFLGDGDKVKGVPALQRPADGAPRPGLQDHQPADSGCWGQPASWSSCRGWKAPPCTRSLPRRGRNPRRRSLWRRVARSRQTLRVSRLRAMRHRCKPERRIISPTHYPPKPSFPRPSEASFLAHPSHYPLPLRRRHSQRSSESRSLPFGHIRNQGAAKLRPFGCQPPPLTYLPQNTTNRGENRWQMSYGQPARIELED